MTAHRTDGKIPRSPNDDYTTEAAGDRREFLREHTGVALEHVAEGSFDPALAQGNIENFIGVAQVPLGVAGPLLVRGSTPRVSSTFRWPPPRARWWRATTAACASCARPEAC